MACQSPHTKNNNPTPSLRATTACFPRHHGDYFTVDSAPAASGRLRTVSSMNVINQHFAPPPHLLNNRLSPSRNSMSSTTLRRPYYGYELTHRLSTALSPSHSMSSRKRKADDEGSGGDDDRMSASPSGSPAVLTRPLPRHSTKRMRTNISGRPLPLPRLLETLNADEMRNLLRSICERHPDIGNEVTTTAPRPSVQSTLEVLGKYESQFQAAFPLGRTSSDYSYNRVRQNLIELLDSLKDFTPHFLPPNESQPATSLAFLDGATEIIHRLPDWDTYQHNRHKQEAYEEMAKAWAAVIREAAKKAGGIQLQYGGWDQKIAKHNEASGGRMQEAVNELRGSLGWMGSDAPTPAAGGPADTMSIRQQLLNGTYGMSSPVRVGPW